MLPTAAPGVIFKRVGDGAVLLHTETEVYFGLNAVAARVWELLPPACTSLDQICAELGRQYPDVAPDELRADIEELFADLAAQGLIQAASTASL